MTVKWVFTDPTDSSTATFDINPNDFPGPNLIKNIQATSTVAPGGATIFMEGAAQPQDITFSGVSLTEAQYDMFVTWFTKRHPIQLTDDLGRTFNIYIKEFQPKRVRSHTNFWRHEYTVTAIWLS